MTPAVGDPHVLAALTGPSALDLAECLRFGDHVLSSAELLSRAQAVARAIVEMPAVAVHASPTPSTVVAVVAGLLAGVPIVPVPMDSAPDEIRYLVDDSGAGLMLGGDVPWPVVPRLSVPMLPVGKIVGSAPLPSAIDPSDTGLIMYTSGTTGRPKGVQLSRRAIAAGLDGLAEVWRWTPDDVLVHGLPLFHVHGLVLGVLGALRVGSPLIHTGRPTPQAYAAAAGTLYFGVPTVWTRISRDRSSAAALSSARLLVSGSAGLPLPVFEAIAAATGNPPIERYGMTETLITLSTRADGERRPGWVGQPIPGVEALVVDDHDEPVPADAKTLGHLLIRGTTMFDGYLRRPDDTAAVLGTDGWLRTGDIALVDATGMHRIVGRASTDLISSGGYRIGAGEIEDALLAHPGVHEVAVVGRPHDDLGEHVVAYVVGEFAADQHGAERELIDFVAHTLATHKQPRQIRFVDALPRNAMGKVVKGQLP